ncbi:MAG: tRNA 2-thiouridine(34) synthase MnmA [Synergistetes bacterium]|nr:tRNA 2-thiouridine(34) synthase MnmA [Synergistota bacterium]
MGDSIVVAMSGGIDSGVAAYLLQRDGYKIIGVFLRFYDGPTQDAAYNNLKCLGDRLGIRVYEVDAREIFRKQIIEKFVEGIQAGITPNPCIRCNKVLKVGFLLEYAAKRFGVSTIATGHYAIVERRSCRFLLRRGIDVSKEQSYFLYTLSQDELSHLVLPLGRYTKAQVRTLAKNIGLDFKNIRESQDICFVEGDYKGWLVRAGVHYQPGDVVDLSGRVVGRHRGLPFYTIGQRRGLGDWGGGPYYVVAKDTDNNILVVGRRDDCRFSGAVLRDVNIIYEDFTDGKKDVTVKVRYATDDVPATLYWDGNRLCIRFRKKMFGVTPGQSAVFYVGEYVFGGGVIEEAIN